VKKPNKILQAATLFHGTCWNQCSRKPDRRTWLACICACLQGWEQHTLRVY